MEKYNWQSKIKINIILLRIMGLWPKGDQTYKPGFYLVYSLITVSLFVFGHIFFQAINVYFIAHDLQSIAATSYLLLIEMLGAVKAFYLIKNMRILKERMIIFKSDWFQPKNVDQRNLIEPAIYFWRTVYRMFLTMCFGCNTFWAIYPMVDKTSEERRLPFLGWYPYDYKKSPFYEITYVYQVIGICYLTTVHVNVDTLISAFNVYTACQFDMLCDNLKNFANVSEDCDDIYRSMMMCMEHHKNILKFIQSSTKFFNWILFWHLLISGISIGITMFQLTMVVPLSSEFYSLLSYGIAITIQIFMYCWFGNEVQAKSSNLSYAIFETNWMDLSESTKKDLLFFSMHLKPVQISALNLFYLSLETYMRILKTAWSYFALLYQVTARE